MTTMEVEPPKENENQRREEDMDLSNTVFPHDIMLDILSRPPTKYLVQSRFSSKSWYKSVRNKVRESKGILIIRDVFDDIYTLENFQEPNQVVEIKKARLSDRESRLRCRNIWGSCNGLICIELFRVVDWKSSLYLWNPTTMQYKKIPYSKTHRPGSQTAYGFGYNLDVDDYEILGVTCINESLLFRSAVNIYSVRKNSWRTLLDIPYSIYNRSTSGVQCNGAFHWVAWTSDSRRYQYYPLIAYEPRGEVCREIPPPNSIESCDITVHEFRGKLCILRLLTLWVMNDYGVRDSWTKFLNVGDTVDRTLACYPLCLTEYGLILRVSGFDYIFRRDDNIVLYDHDIVLYDPEKKNCSKIQRMGSVYEVIYCLKSIVEVGITCSLKPYYSG